jgi:hypothetical protein
MSESRGAVKFKQQIFPKSFFQHAVKILGMITKCMCSGRLCVLYVNCFNATLAAAVGGTQTQVECL